MIEEDVLFIFGAQSTALEIAELAALAAPSKRIFHVVGNAPADAAHNLLALADLPRFTRQVAGRCFGIISMANHALRLQRAATMREANITPISLIHPQATVAPSATVGEGCYIAAGARVSSHATIAAHCMLNLNATIGHHATLGEHCVVNPGAALSGHAALGQRVLLGANAFVLQSITVGDDCSIDAMAYVHRDIPPQHTVSSRSRLIVLPKLTSAQ